MHDMDSKRYEMRILNRVIIGILVCLFTVLCALDVQSQTQPRVPPPSKRILLLHAYGDGIPVYQKTNPAFLAVMQAAGVSFDDIFFEYLDLQRNKDAEHRRNLAILFRHKYADKKIDLIIAVHELALNFILHEGKDLFPGIPVVSYITPDEVQISDTSRRFLLLPMHLDNRGTLDMALTLFPKTKRVVYIADLSKSGKKLESEAKKAFAPWENKLKLEYTSNLTVEEILQRVASLPPGTIVIYNNVWTDRTGRTFIGRDVGDKIIKASNAPVFSLYDTLIGRGIVGGSLLSFEAEAKRAGKFALDILNGKLVLAEPVTTIGAPGTPLLDWRELVRWEVSEDRVPKGSIILSRSHSFWQLYKQYIVAVSVFILGLLILVFVLLLQIRRRKEAEKTLKEYVGQLDGMVKERTGELTRANEQLLNEITGRKRAEEVIKQSEEKYRDIFDKTIQGIYRTTPAGHFILLNPVFARICGYDSPEKMMGKVTSIANQLYANPEDRLRFQKLIAVEGEVKGFEVAFKHPTKGLVWISINSKLLRDEQGNIQYYDGTIYDITERKQATKALQDSEERYHSLFENMMEGFAYYQIIFAEGRPQDLLYLDVNKAFSQLTGLKDVVGRKITEVIPGIKEANPELLEIYGRVALTGKPEQFEDYFEPLKAWLSISVYSPAKGCCVAVFDNITERKQAEEKIKASLLEKETMLKEIHHRVKNNLQVISSLLDLQSSYLQDEKAKEMLQNSMDRVSTMAKIHTMLYQSKDMSRVDFGGFIRDLASRLQQSYGFAESPVEVHADIADVSLTIETSIPCGLILNELVSNALKHAFPEGKGGEVNISMKSEGDQFTLMIQDNGIGFPASVDFQNPRSLGLELVSLLVKQLNGRIYLEVDGGTKFTITFPMANKRG